METEEKDPAAVSLGRRGGLARAKLLPAQERLAIALKASKAAAKARRRKAREKKAKAEK